MPPAAGPDIPLVDDKVLHFLGFTVLGALLVWRLGRHPRRPTVRNLLPWYLALILYGAFDEITQPPFGRDCEFLDWLADCCGAAVGVALGAMATGRPQ
ncbi:MAG TPA: VanZ family protein [Phycisphaerae bacterium]|nr:VanZ family protein [Phycisphaerae bacterium]